MKIIRRLEEFDKLENGMGLRVFIDNNDKTLSVGVPWKSNLINRISLSKVDSEIIALIKAMGFEFEWKPKMTEDEILSKYEPCKFIKHVCDHYVRSNGPRYVIAKDIDYPKFGYCYYNKETAKKICEELNS